MTPDDRHAQLPAEAEARSIEDLVRDCAEVTRHLAEVPGSRRAVSIPELAVGVVAGLDSYGD